MSGKNPASSEELIVKILGDLIELVENDMEDEKYWLGQDTRLIDLWLQILSLLLITLAVAIFGVQFTQFNNSEELKPLITIASAILGVSIGLLIPLFVQRGHIVKSRRKKIFKLDELHRGLLRVRISSRKISWHEKGGPIEPIDVKGSLRDRSTNSDPADNLCS